ncbi:rhodanese-like domain-containing protein [Micromonospora sp. NPDC051925]|uniref:rhodanese-like domain-containing protein n=1 Tax=Micromonospora sp. NPDC051925 TaxID=3364288 RepID=UPI0037C8135E
MPQHTTRTESCPTPPPGSRGIDEILAEARARLCRLDPEQAHLAYRGGALMVDIRPAAQRAAHGTVPGARVIERNVLEWRLDPRCPARLPEAVGYDLPVLVICQEGYTSSLAAAALQDLGLHRATDVVGGFVAWRIAGLPTLGPTLSHRSPSLAPPVTAGRTPH